MKMEMIVLIETIKIIGKLDEMDEMDAFFQGVHYKKRKFIQNF